MLTVEIHWIVKYKTDLNRCKSSKKRSLGFSDMAFYDTIGKNVNEAEILYNG